MCVTEINGSGSGHGGGRSIWHFVRLRLQTILDDFGAEATGLVRLGQGREEAHVLGTAGNLDDVIVAELARSGAHALNGATGAAPHNWGISWIDGRTLYSGLAEPTLGGALIAFALMPEDGQHLAVPQTLVLLLSYLVSEVAASAPLDLSLMDSMPWAAALVDSSALILFMNERAKCVATRHPQVDVDQGRLRLRRSALDRTMRDSLHEVAGGQRTRAIIPVLDRSGVVSLALQLEALPRPPAFAAGHGSAVAYLIELRASNAPDRRALASLFSLSAREARLTELLCRGLRLDAASQAMGISRNTAKIHLRHVLEKTGTSSQVDLARVLSHLPEIEEPSDGTGGFALSQNN